MNAVQEPKAVRKNVHTLTGLLSKHFSFLVLLSGSGIYYLFNLVLKYILNDEEYGDYGLFHSFVSIALTFAVVGGDQLLLRLASIKNGDVVIPKKVMYLNVGLLTLFSVLSPIIFIYYSNIKLSFISLFLCSLLSGINIILFTVLRLKGAFTMAQVQKNGWKIILFMIAMVYFLFELKITVQAITYFNIISIGITTVLLFGSKEELNFKIKNKSNLDYKLWFNFALSMLIMNLISYGDRFIIDTQIGRADVGHYFFLQNLFLFPLIQLQTYSGFRELVAFKRNYSSSLLKSSLKRNLLLGLMSSVLLIGIIGILSFIVKDAEINWYQDWLIILFLMTIGLFRVCYSVLSAALGAVGNANQIRLTNLSTIIFSIFLFFLLSQFGFTLENITIFMAFIWLGRGLSYYFVLIKIKE
jgi:O-antigen/teichoic acid export membrane protein